MINQSGSDGCQRRRFFQSVQSFNDTYKTEAECVEVLYAAFRSEDRIYCHQCQGRDVDHEVGARTIVCVECGEESYFTAGSLFHKARVIRPRLAAIWLYEQGISFSAGQFADAFDIALSSAWMMLHRISKVIHDSMRCKTEAVSSRMFVPIICKRSRETQLRQHPASEAETFPIPESSTETCPLTDTEQTVLEALAAVPTDVDQICNAADLPSTEVLSALGVLEVAGLARSAGGHLYSRILNHMSMAADALNEHAQKVLAHVFTFVRETFHGISFKYLECYLARYWCAFDRRRWCKPRLLKGCVQAPYRPMRDTPDRQSPPSVLMWTNRKV